MNKIDVGQITTKSTESKILVSVRDQVADGVVIRLMVEDLDRLEDAVAYLSVTEAIQLSLLLHKAVETRREMVDVKPGG